MQFSWSADLQRSLCTAQPVQWQQRADRALECGSAASAAGTAPQAGQEAPRIVHGTRSWLLGDMFCPLNAKLISDLTDGLRTKIQDYMLTS